MLFSRIVKAALMVLPLIFSSSLFATDRWIDCQMDLLAGYRQDDFKWSVAGKKNIPNVLSEVKWKDLKIFQLGGKFKCRTCHGFYGRLQGDYGWIEDGKNQDSDYSKNNRQGEFSRSVNKADDGHVYDGSIGLGYSFNWLCQKIWISPLVGYSFHGQHLVMKDGVQKVAANPSRLGPIKGLNSKYNALWNGPWLGFDVEYTICPCVDIWGSFEYHWAKYEGKGHWNLREDFFDDFRQTADGEGVVAWAGINYALWECGLIGLTLEYQNWETAKGRDRIYQYVGALKHSFDTRFNKAEWQSLALSVEFSVTF